MKSPALPVIRRAHVAAYRIVDRSPRRWPRPRSRDPLQLPRRSPKCRSARGAQRDSGKAKRQTVQTHTKPNVVEARKKCMWPPEANARGELRQSAAPAEVVVGTQKRRLAASPAGRDSLFRSGGARRAVRAGENQARRGAECETRASASATQATTVGVARTVSQIPGNTGM